MQYHPQIDNFQKHFHGKDRRKHIVNFLEKLIFWRIFNDGIFGGQCNR